MKGLQNIGILSPKKLSRKIGYGICLSAVIFIVTLGCADSGRNPAYEMSDSLPSYSQEEFENYISETQGWLSENRVFITQDPNAELDLVSPREYVPQKPNDQGILLIHGLGDTPYSFRDIASHLAAQGYLVRTILLPGHASKAGDLQLASFEDWQGTVDHHVKLLKKKTSSVWLGGYSTGANLTTAYAMKDPSIEGLLLFSPALKPVSEVVKYADILSVLVTWADRDPETNPLRYNSLPMNAAAAYYQTSKEVRKLLEQKTYDKPVFVVMSEHDSVIDTGFVVDTFKNKMTHPDNQLVWLGESDIEDSRATRFSMNIPSLRISNGSHMGLLFSPQNDYYGIKGKQRICENGQEKDIKPCLVGEDVWYSAWGYNESDKIHARLTFNPYFENTMDILDQLLASKSQS